MMKISASEIAKAFTAELAWSEARSEALRDVVASIDRLAAIDRPKRRNQANSQRTKKSAPPHRSQILDVMRQSPAKQWTVAELTSATSISSSQSVRTVMSRLRNSGEVVTTMTGSFQLAAPHEDICGETSQ